MSQSWPQIPLSVGLRLNGMHPLKLLASTGAALIGYLSYKSLKFIYVHFIRSSDGIGRGFAEELCHRGFNVIIHGRNKTKLNGVKAELKSQWPESEVRTVVIDAGAATEDELSKLATSLADINLTVLVNNVGGNGNVKPLWSAFSARTAPEIDTFLDINARFPTQLTKAVFPDLLRSKASLIINIGSGVSTLAAPYLSLYAASKAYDLVWSASLRAEMHAEGHNVDVMGVLVGTVQSNSARRPTNFFTPSSRMMAAATLDVVGCGESVVWAYWPHALLFGFVGMLPSWLVQRMVTKIAREGMEEEMKEMKGI